RLCPDRDTQILLLVLGLAPFIEAVSGFGVGTVVVIPMLMALGLDTLQAATLGLLGQLAVPWGGLAVGITLGAELTGLHSGVIGAYTALITAPLPIGFGIAALAIYGGKAAVKRLWLAVVAASIVLVAGEWFFSQMPGVELAGAFAGVPTTILLALWGHFAARQANSKSDLAHTTSQATLERTGDISSPRFLLALAPYIILIGALLIIPAIELRFQLLYNPGFYVLLAALAAALLLHTGAPGFRTALGKTARQF